MQYRGRFAPSPSGPLHAGSLVAALGSYLDARAQQGEWLLRIENIDPPREVEGAAEIICQQLHAHGLFWDGPIHWQSESEQAFNEIVSVLLETHHAYYCTCTRAEIKARGGHYDGYCRHRQQPASHASIRFINDAQVTAFDDLAKGHIEVPELFATEDFVLKRRDGLWAYQLAVVYDDYMQGITQVVRGSDLLFPTVWQISLWQTFQTLSERKWIELPYRPIPQYRHLPLLLDNRGQKLSKQNHAPAIDNRDASDNLFAALQALSLNPPMELKGADNETLLNFGIQAWQKILR